MMGLYLKENKQTLDRACSSEPKTKHRKTIHHCRAKNGSLAVAYKVVPPVMFVGL